MNIADAPPEDLFEPFWLEAYTKSVDALWSQLVRLNSSLLILERIITFPFELFEASPHHFWRLTENALFEACVMTFWRTVLDTDSQVLTLSKLKNEIAEHIKAEYSGQLRAALKTLTFERRIESFGRRIKDIRNNYLAHFKLDRHLQPNAEELKEDKAVFDELRDFASVANDYFNFLCFGKRRALLPWGYISESGGSLDIDDILSKIAFDSPMLNAPEINPGLWPDVRQGLSREEIDAINRYRTKLKLPGI